MAGVLPGAAERGGAGNDPAADAELADAVGPALLLVLDALAPAGRLAFVLHDLFGVPFDESAAILGRSPEAARQLASRARRREAVDAFLRASRGGGFAALLTVLDPDAVVRADATAVQLGAAPAVRGATAVLDTFLGRAVGAQPAIVGGVAGAARAPGGRIRAVLGFAVGDGRVAALDLVADRERLDRLDVELRPREGT